MMKARNFRKRSYEDDEDNNQSVKIDDDEQQGMLALEEIKFLQKQREKRSGIPALPTAAQNKVAVSTSGLVPKKVSEKSEADGENEELVLQDTFALETAVQEEDPNMTRYVEQKLAERRGKKVDEADRIENEVKQAEDELYNIPDHLKVKRRNSEESSTQWTTGIAEIQLPIEYKLKNIEETEAAKKLLQEKRLSARSKTESTMPASYSADYFQRGRDYAEKLRKEHPELYKDKRTENTAVVESKQSESGGNPEGAGRRQAATDEIMLDRFRKRERHRVMRR